MNVIKNFSKSLNEITLLLAQNTKLQKLLLVDEYDVDAAPFSPLSAQEMIDKHYICITPQNESGIQKMGRNTFLVITLQDVSFVSMDGNTAAAINIDIITNINYALIKNNKDRCLEIAEEIVNNLNNLKLTASGTLTPQFLTRLNYTETLTGYRLKMRISNQTTKEVDF